MRLLVCGDILIDEFRFIAFDRPSPEAAMPIMRQERIEAMLGGAGAVATMAAQLGAQVTIAAPVYRGWYEFRIPATLKKAGVRRLDGTITHDPSPAYHELPCVKTRYVLNGRPHGFRLDDEHYCEWRSLAAVSQVLFADAVLVSDYGKGAVSAELFAALAAECQARNVPLLVDPARGRSWDMYRGATLIKCNRAQWDAADNQHPPGADLVVTDGANGMHLDTRDGSRQLFPAEPCAVRCAVGAGDAVLSTLGCALAAGIDLPDACRWANRVAALCCGELGARLPLAIGSAGGLV